MYFRATLILLALFLIPIGGTQWRQNHRAQAATPSPIHLNVTVTDKSGALVKGLQADHFEISVAKKPARVVSFSDADSPVSVGIVFDSSGSMQSGSDNATRKNFFVLREALRRFLELNNESNEYFLLGFNVKPQLLIDWTSDRTKLNDNFDHLNVFGNSAFYDACYLAVDKLQRGRHAKRVLILISDGEDNVSRYTFVELRELLKNSGVILYAINFPREVDAGSSVGMEGRGVLEELSSLTGGVAIYSTAGRSLRFSDAQTVFERIANELRHQYAISIVTDEPNNSQKWRKIKVRIKPPTNASKNFNQLTARTRAGFY